MMEIERKFLVKYLPVNYTQNPKLEVWQDYISVKPVIRIRKQKNDNNKYEYILTIKAAGELTREEYEIKLTAEEYENLLKKKEFDTIHKTRYFIEINDNHIAELDIYHNKKLNGLITVEVEFESEQAALKFITPDWFGEDVTYNNAYKNSALATLL